MSQSYAEPSIVGMTVILNNGEDGPVDRAPHPGRVWSKIPDNIHTDLLDMALDIPELSPRELAGTSPIRRAILCQKVQYTAS